MSTIEIYVLVIFALMLIVFRGLKSRATKVRSSRLERVRRTSHIFSICLFSILLLGVYSFLGFLLGWPVFTQHHMRMVISDNHIYSSPSDMPKVIFWLMITRQGLAFFAIGTLLRLFWLYSKGILFTGRNVNCIRFLGYYFIVDWFIKYLMQSLLQDVDLSFTPLFVGVIIDFFAWIMDEGRKIKEEQELTV
jgi:hypothetical protein